MKERRPKTSYPDDLVRKAVLLKREGFGYGGVSRIMKRKGFDIPPDTVRYFCTLRSAQAARIVASLDAKKDHR